MIVDTVMGKACVVLLPPLHARHSSSGVRTCLFGLLLQLVVLLAISKMLKAPKAEAELQTNRASSSKLLAEVSNQVKAANYFLRGDHGRPLIGATGSWEYSLLCAIKALVDLPLLPRITWVMTSVDSASKKNPFF